MNCAHSNLIAGTPTSVGVRTPTRLRTLIHRPGFSFTEILFAVMVLGIGFIMIAAIFPVAIKQTQATSQETNAATIAKEADSYLAPLSSYMWPTGLNGTVGDNVVYPISQSVTAQLWQRMSGTMILPSDRRYAWVGMFRRGYTPDLTDAASADSPGKNTASQFAQIIVIAMQVHNKTVYDGSDVVNTVHTGSSTGLATLEPRFVNALFNTGQPNTVTITDSPVGKAGSSAAVAEGAYLVISDDGIADANKNGAGHNSNVTGSTNGFIFRIGNNQGGNVWQLMPGNDTVGSAVATSNLNGVTASCLIVGRGFDDGDGVYAGPVQDAAVYTTFVSP